MTALSANKDVPRKEGKIEAYLVEDNVHIYKGAQVVVNSSGFAEPLTDAASKKFVGMAYEECDNTLTGHTQGGKTVRVNRDGVYKMAASSITQAMVGDRMYGVDDATVDNVSNYSIFTGTLIEYVSATVGWVDIKPAIFEDSTMTKVLTISPTCHAPAATGWAEEAGGVGLVKNKSAKTFTVPVEGLEIGDIITSIAMKGGIGATTDKTTVLDCSLYKVVGAAGGKTASSIQAMDQVSKVVDYLVNETKAVASPETVAAGEEFYFLVTGTTADDDACDIVVTGLEVTVTRTIR